jgi:XTP/dITP diphosphohydrolase
MPRVLFGAPPPAFQPSGVATSVMIPLLLATRNPHKVREMRAILGESFRLLTLDDFPGAPHIVEDAPTFAGNAIKKAVGLAKWLAPAPSAVPALPQWVLADDSGLEVDALHGAPGVHSARFAALEHQANLTGNFSDAENNAKLLRLLAGVPAAKRTARFRCVIALTPVLTKKIEAASPVCYADEFEMQTEQFDGVCEGRILFEPRGQNGFGYDPLFVPEGYEQTFAELGADVKNQISHRARALVKVRDYLGRR